MKPETLFSTDRDEMIAEGFGRFIARFCDDQTVIGLCRHLCSEMVRGQICLDLDHLANAGHGDSPATLREALLASTMAGPPEADRPLVLDGNRLYLRKQWEEERALADALIRRCPATTAPAIRADDPEERAFILAETENLTSICGGPGTGKTTLAGKIIAKLIGRGIVDPRQIAMAAPTGRAARRLGEALAKCLTAGSENLGPSRTLHALLGIMPHESRPRHHRGNPVAATFVVADECSMISLSAMRQLLDALPDDARLLLLGDPSQLASVDAGAVLADLAAAATHPGSPLNRSLVTLEKNHRFPESSGIHRLASAVRSGDAMGALGVLDSIDEGGDLHWSPLPARADFRERFREIVAGEYAALAGAATPEAAIGQLGRFRMLTPLRNGPVGVTGLNALAVELLFPPNRISIDSSRLAGMPVIVTRNDHARRLYNGDTGILWSADAPSAPSAWFEGAEGEARECPLAGLPPHELAYAVTVHKSQGSEYDRVLILLPDDPGPLMTRELLYTALTRARNRVDLWCSREALAAAVKNKTERASGLADALRE